MSAHRYSINSSLPFDVKDLHYLANSCGAHCLMYGHTACIANSGDENVAGVIVQILWPKAFLIIADAEVQCFE